ncbi:MAG: HAMP domain-containing histidine kinase [Eubacterium sp.]|nr:HAMP domain-containing histidine kinase [Eubacterium sp.]
MIAKWRKWDMICKVALVVEIIAAFGLVAWTLTDALGPAERDLVLYGVLALSIIQFAAILFPLRYTHRGALEETRALREEKDQVDSLTREVLGNITHDLKTPLTAIKGYSQGILDGVASDPDKLMKYVTTIRNKSNDMSSLVDELSFFAKIYQKDISYQWQEVSALDYFSSCASDLSLDLETKKISLIFKSEISRTTLVRLDSEKMKRVMNNIIGNASKYIQRNIGILMVRLKEDDESVIVEVADNGVGIAKDELPRIFERFYRTDSSRNSTTGGSGLGLSIAQKIVDDHGGKIWAESEVDQGTTVYISIPKVKGE